MFNIYNYIISIIYNENNTENDNNYNEIKEQTYNNNLKLSVITTNSTIISLYNCTI